MSCPTDQPRDSGCIPLWSNSTWIYKDYPGAATDAITGQFNETNWLNTVSAAINEYNNAQKNASSKITQIYPYVSDLELPWVSGTYTDNGSPFEPLFQNSPSDSDFHSASINCGTVAQPEGGYVNCLKPGIAPAVYWGNSNPNDICNTYGFFFVETTTQNSGNGSASPTPPLIQTGNTTPVPDILNMVNPQNKPYLENITEQAVIIDGRIDNGYLQGLNEFLHPSDAQSLANLVVNGGYSGNVCKYLDPSMSPSQLCNPNKDENCSLSLAKIGQVIDTKTNITTDEWQIQPDLTQAVYQVGVGAFGPKSTYKYTPTINGIQLDLEPFDSTQVNQIAFYNQIATNLKATGQYWSIFTFPKAMTQITADLLNGTNNSGMNTNPSGGNNGYMIVALYDLVDMKNGIPAACEADYTYAGGICDTSAAPPPVSATGDATTAIYDLNVPHSALGYYNAVLLTVKQTIALSKQYGIKYKFAIPASSSVHEFENWGQYMCQFTDFTEVKPINGFCRMYNGLPLNPNSGNPSQIDYMQQALRAIYDGITQMSADYDATLFRGIDLYGFSIRTIWSPQNPIVDYATANVFYGNTPSFVPATPDGYSQGSLVNPPYVYTTPAYPNYSKKPDGTADTNSMLGWLSTVTLDVRPCGTTGGTYCPGVGQTCTNGTCS